MRSLPVRFVILAAIAAALSAGCETQDRMLYNCKRPPFRKHEPPPEPPPVEEPAAYFK